MAHGDLVEYRKVKEALGIILARGKKDLSDYDPGVIGCGVTTHKNIGKSGMYLWIEIQFYENTVTMRTKLASRCHDGELMPVITLDTTSVPYNHFADEHKSTARLWRRCVLQQVTDFTKNFDDLIEKLKAGIDE